MRHLSQEEFYDTGCERVATEEFDYEAVEKAISDRALAEDIRLFRKEIKDRPLTQEEIDRVSMAIQTLFRWVCLSSLRNPNGLTLRFLIVCWQVLPELHETQLTGLAKMFGKHKQSFGRWVDNFKIVFPWARSPHIKRTPTEQKALSDAEIVDGLSRAYRFAEFTKRHPVATWPESAKQKCEEMFR